MFARMVASGCAYFSVPFSNELYLPKISNSKARAICLTSRKLFIAAIVNFSCVSCDMRKRDNAIQIYHFLWSILTGKLICYIESKPSCTVSPQKMNWYNFHSFRNYFMKLNFLNQFFVNTLSSAMSPILTKIMNIFLTCCNQMVK